MAPATPRKSNATTSLADDVHSVIHHFVHRWKLSVLNSAGAKEILVLNVEDPVAEKKRGAEYRLIWLTN
jgi:hypothetical protein